MMWTLNRHLIRMGLVFRTRKHSGQDRQKEKCLPQNQYLRSLLNKRVLCLNAHPPQTKDLQPLTCDDFAPSRVLPEHTALRSPKVARKEANLRANFGVRSRLKNTRVPGYMMPAILQNNTRGHVRPPGDMMPAICQ